MAKQMETKPSSGTRFDYAEMDWIEYSKYRPNYPDALFATIYDYHKSHAGGFGLVYDLGSGSGIVANKLRDQFAHVVVSDPEQDYLEAARDLLSHTSTTKISFVKHGAEHALEIPRGSADLITAGTSLQWTDPSTVLPNLALYLKPKRYGTLAFWMYSANTTVEFGKDDGEMTSDNDGNQNVILEKAFDRLYNRYTFIYDRDVEKQSITTPGATINARFDNFEFDPNLWCDIRRIKWLNDRPAMCTNWPTAESKIREGEQVILQKQSDFFSVTADATWVEQYLFNLCPPIARTLAEEAADDLEAFRTIAGTKPIKVCWPGVLVLASRT